MRLARVVGAIGRVLVAAGVLILLFVGYQLWGTSIETARAQDRLERELEEQLGADRTPKRSTTTTTSGEDKTTTTGTAPTSTAPPLENPPAEGDAVGRIEIPDLNLDWVYIEGVSVRDLKKGPGHYPGTPLPGQKGNAAIAGHRTTYGAPFNRVNELEADDPIRVTTPQGRFLYRVREQRIVSPSEVQVLEDKGDNRLTLTSCNPKYSARDRIIIVADLAGEPLEPTLNPTPRRSDRGQTEAALDDQGLSGESAPKLPVIVWGGASAAIWFVAWLLGRWWRKWPAYLLGLPFFLVTLYLFFQNTSRLVPANY